MIDVAKAIGAALGAGTVVAAVPTTLSAAEMTWVHRHARGVDAQTPRVRPRIVLNDPALSASQPLPELAASAANALGHAVEGCATALASPVPTLAAQDAARRLAGALPATTASRTATSWRSARCSRATRSTPTGTACTTS